MGRHPVAASPGGPERFELAAVARRGGHPESWHFAAAAVVTPTGRPVAALGDPAVSAFLRSAAKPFQAMPLVDAGGCESYRLEEADLALICASHSGTREHLVRVEALLERGGSDARQLACGPHPPTDEAAAAELLRLGREPTRLHNNCSGKHAGMLLACKLLELPLAGYTRPEHPLQQRILAELCRHAGLAESRIAVGGDGCGAPAYSLPLSAAARAYAALADPGAAGLAADGEGTAARIVAAMTGEPRMVAGPGCFTTRLMEVTGGRVLGKEGAAGYYAMAVRGPVALGVALKIADGSEACRDGVVLELLRQLGVLSGEEFRQLESFHRRLVRDWNGEPVGELAPELALREV